MIKLKFRTEMFTILLTGAKGNNNVELYKWKFLTSRVYVSDRFIFL